VGPIAFPTWRTFKQLKGLPPKHGQQLLI
jgi:hypothetical protein